MMRCIRNVTRLELDYRDYEFVNIEANARKDGIITSLGIKHPIWTCHSLKIRTVAIDENKTNQYDKPTENSFTKVM